MSRALSLPHEHGGYLTIAGATVAGVALAQAWAPAAGAGVAVAAAFFARAPVEQLARHRGARFDVATIVALAAVILGCALVLGGTPAAVALATAFAIVVGSALARQARWQRSTWFETLGMAALGASAGLIALAGGATLGLGAALAVVVGTHTALAVPLVRTEVRPRERQHARFAAGVALAVLAVAALALVLLGTGRLALALCPRALHALRRLAAPATPARPNVVGVRETVMLAVVIAALVALAR